MNRCTPFEDMQHHQRALENLRTAKTFLRDSDKLSCWLESNTTCTQTQYYCFICMNKFVRSAQLWLLRATKLQVLNRVTFKHISRWDYRFDFSPIPRVKRAKSVDIPPLAARCHIRDVQGSFCCFYSASGAEMQSVHVAIFSPFPANHLRFAYVINITRSSSSSSSSAYRKYSSSGLEEGLQKLWSNDKIKTLNALVQNMTVEMKSPKKVQVRDETHVEEEGGRADNWQYTADLFRY